LQRNVYASDPDAGRSAALLAHYVRSAAAAMAAQDAAVIASGVVEFRMPEVD
jgi:hypothetical protein